jgi:hypothetical protein
VSSSLSHARPLAGALLAALVPASFGFWGAALVRLPDAAPGPEPGSEAWLDHPIDPVRSARIIPAVTRFAVEARGARRNPFLSAHEAQRFGIAAAHAPLPALQPQGDVYPRLQAVVRTDAGRVAILDGEVARAGDRVAGIEVVRVEKHRVLVRGAQGSRWLELAPSAGAPATEEP